MTEKKQSADSFADDLGEDFDFGDEFDSPKSSAPNTPGPRGPRGPNKIVLLLVFGIVILSIGYFGIKYLYGGSGTPSAQLNTPGTSPIAQITPQPPKAAAPKKEEKPVTKELIAEKKPETKPEAKPETKPEIKTPIASKDSKTPIPTPIPQQKTPGMPTKEMPVKETAKEESSFSESDIAKVFMSTGAKPVPAQSSPNHGTTPNQPGVQATQPALPGQPQMTAQVTPTTAPTTPPSTELSTGQAPGQAPKAEKSTATAQAGSLYTPGIKPTGEPVTQAATPPADSQTTGKMTIQEMQRDLFTPPPPPKNPIKKEGHPQTHPQAHPHNSNPDFNLADVQKTQVQEGEQLSRTMDVLSKLNQQMENNLNQVKYLEAYTREISDTVSKLNSQISAMDNRILALTNTANSLSKDVGTVRNEVGHVKQALGDEGVYIDVPASGKAAAIIGGKEELIISSTPQKCKDIVVEELQYALHAVIPGRAWLKSQNGQIVTVTEGDSIGNYGKVLVIDAGNGVVLTSSGITFR